METTEDAIKEHYIKEMKAVEYVNFIAELVKKAPGFHRFPLTCIYDILHSGRFKGSKLLEIGSGAMVHNIASASAFFPNIVMSDFVEDNCEELKRWLEGKSSLRQLLDIPAELEGYGGDLEAGRRLLENRIRKNVKQVVRCDVLSENVFLEEVKPEVAPPYDLITTFLCLMAPTPDFDKFVGILKRINKLLRPGGGLLLVDFLEGGNWKLYETEFHHMKISEMGLRKALKESGFGKIDLRKHNLLHYNYKNNGYYCLAAEKL